MPVASIGTLGIKKKTKTKKTSLTSLDIISLHKELFELKKTQVYLQNQAWCYLNSFFISSISAIASLASEVKGIFVEATCTKIIAGPFGVPFPFFCSKP